jgi:hypothetical protein
VIRMEPSTYHGRGKRRSQAARIGRIKGIATTRVGTAIAGFPCCCGVRVGRSSAPAPERSGCRPARGRFADISRTAASPRAAISASSPSTAARTESCTASLRRQSAPEGRRGLERSISPAAAAPRAPGARSWPVPTPRRR